MGWLLLIRVSFWMCQELRGGDWDFLPWPGSVSILIDSSMLLYVLTTWRERTIIALVSAFE